MRNRVALMLLFLSWPVCLINLYWKNDPKRTVRWICYDYQWGTPVSQDFKWYIVQNELWLSATLVLLAFLIAKSKTKSIRIMLRGLLLVSIVDIVNYWLWFRRNEQALIFEGMIMLWVAILIIKHESTRTSYEKAN
jgi:hypothetical protein